MKYKLIIEESGENLSYHISAALKEGWELYGPPFSHQGYFCQAIIWTEK